MVVIVIVLVVTVDVDDSLSRSLGIRIPRFKFNVTVCKMDVVGYPHKFLGAEAW